MPDKTPQARIAFVQMIPPTNTTEQVRLAQGPMAQGGTFARMPAEEAEELRAELERRPCAAERPA